MTASQPCVLLIDIEPPLQEMVSRTLQDDGFRVVAATSDEAIGWSEKGTIDLVMCDLRPPYPAGCQRCRTIGQHLDAPIIVMMPPDIAAETLTALAGEVDEYLAKPFKTENLLAHVDAALRRGRREQRSSSHHLHFDGLEIDLAEKRLLRDGQVVRLSRIEWALFEVLIRNRGAVLTHQMLLRRVWGDTYRAEHAYLHVYIGRLRRKLEADPSAPRYLITEPGVGYRFELPKPEHPSPDGAPAPAPAAAPPTPAKDSAPAVPVPVAAPTVPTNLPTSHMPFFGREQEVTTASKLLRRADVRLVTLSGTGGIGKTRLAIQVAADMAGDFAQGVFFVPLAPIRDPDLVISTIAQTLDVSASGDQPVIESLTSFLRDRQILLVLDNCEQVVAAAPNLAELVLAAPGLKLLVTSRVALRIAGEYEFPVLPLALPNLRRLPPLHILAESPAVALFAERSRMVSPDFALTDQSAPIVAEICVCVEGLPLAIELAAARTRLLSPKAMLARLSSRLGVLSGGLRDVPERHRSLRAVIDWSYELLAPGEQTLFARLGVFVGGCTLDAVEAVCMPTEASGRAVTDVFAGIDSLLDNNLLAREQRGDGDVRFVMLETIREYALERLAEQAEAEIIRRHYAAHYLALAERAVPKLVGAEQVEWLERLEREHDNLRAVLDSADKRGDIELFGRMAAVLWRFWLTHGHLREGRVWLDRALALGVYSAEVHSRILQGAGALAWNQSDYEQAKRYFEAMLALSLAAEDEQAIAQAFNDLGLVAYMQQNYAQATEHFEASLALKQKLGDRHGIAITLNHLGSLACELEDFTRAEALFQEALVFRKELGDKRGLAITLVSMAYVLRHRAAFDEAAALLESSLVLERELGNTLGIAHTLFELGAVMMQRGNLIQASRYFIEALALFHVTGHKERIAECLESLANLATKQAQAARAAQLYGAAAALRSAINSPIPSFDLPEYEQVLATAQALVAPDTWATAWAEGQAMALEQAVAYAIG